jgi:hypothetical protein
MLPDLSRHFNHLVRPVLVVRTRRVTNIKSTPVSDQLLQQLQVNVAESNRSVFLRSFSLTSGDRGVSPGRPGGTEPETARRPEIMTSPGYPEGSIPLSLPRKWVGDLLHFARRIPSVPVEFTMDLGSLAALRKRPGCEASWPVLFLKAYALVCREIPELRQSYLSWPYRRLWQHAASTASVAISRMFGDERAVFFVKIREPESRSLRELDQVIRHHREAPWDTIGSFRRAVRTTRYPLPIRRAVWSLGLDWSGRWKERYFGTFGLSVYSSTGADSPHPLAPLTTLLNYGPISPRGSVKARIVYDHRVMDGLLVAGALRRLNEHLQTTIADELQNLAGRSAA